MRGVVFKLCLIASAVEVDLDTYGAMYERRPGTSITGAGGRAAVPKSRRTHLADAVVRRFGLGALWDLVADTKNKTVVLEALRTHPKDVEVQRRGLAALRDLAADASNRRLIAEEGGIAVVLEALRAHPKSCQIHHPMSPRTYLPPDFVVGRKHSSFHPSPLRIYHQSHWDGHRQESTFVWRTWR